MACSRHLSKHFSLLYALKITEENFVKWSDIAIGVKFHAA
jgi:hypothetical protein